MKKTTLTFLGLILVMLGTACEKSKSNNNNSVDRPDNRCARYVGADYDRCMEDYNRQYLPYSGSNRWASGELRPVSGEARQAFEGYVEANTFCGVDTFFDSPYECHNRSSKIYIEMSSTGLTSGSSVNVIMYTLADQDNKNWIGYGQLFLPAIFTKVNLNGEQLEIHYQQLSIIIKQKELTNSSMPIELHHSSFGLISSGTLSPF